MLVMVPLCIAKVCCGCKMRDCRCIKRCLRCCCIDRFDDFHLMIAIEEIAYPSEAAIPVLVEFSAGRNSERTPLSSSRTPGDQFVLFVEQGTVFLKVTLRGKNDQVLGTKMEAMREILEEADHGVHQESFDIETTLEEAPTITVGVAFRIYHDVSTNRDPNSDLEKKMALMMQCRLAHFDLPAEAERVASGIISEQQAAGLDVQVLPRGIVTAQPSLSSFGNLMLACHGLVDIFTSWGAPETVYLGVKGPPSIRRFALCIFPDADAFTENNDCSKEIELVKIQSIHRDPSRDDVFAVVYSRSSKSADFGLGDVEVAFRKVDRSRDEWVEMLRHLVVEYREQKLQRRKGTAGGGGGASSAFSTADIYRISTARVVANRRRHM